MTIEFHEADPIARSWATLDEDTQKEIIQSESFAAEPETDAHAVELVSGVELYKVVERRLSPAMVQACLGRVPPDHAFYFSPGAFEATYKRELAKGKRSYMEGFPFLFMDKTLLDRVEDHPPTVVDGVQHTGYVHIPDWYVPSVAFHEIELSRAPSHHEREGFLRSSVPGSPRAIVKYVNLSHAAIGSVASQRAITSLIRDAVQPYQLSALVAIIDARVQPLLREAP